MELIVIVRGPAVLWTVLRASGALVSLSSCSLAMESQGDATRLYTVGAVTFCAPGTMPLAQSGFAIFYASLFPCMRKAVDVSGLHTWLHILFT